MIWVVDWFLSLMRMNFLNFPSIISRKLLKRFSVRLTNLKNWSADKVVASMRSPLRRPQAGCRRTTILSLKSNFSMKSMMIRVRRLMFSLQCVQLRSDTVFHVCRVLELVLHLVGTYENGQFLNTKAIQRKCYPKLYLLSAYRIESCCYVNISVIVAVWCAWVRTITLAGLVDLNGTMHQLSAAQKN